MSEPSKSKTKSDPVASAVARIARWLAAADRTEAELRQRLEAALFDPATIDAAIEKARAYGWLDDRRIAARQVEKDRKERALGKGRIVQRLANRGIDPEQTDDLLRERPDEEVARAILWLKGRRWASVSAAGRALAARGYEEEAIRSALEEVFPGWEFAQDSDE